MSKRNKPWGQSRGNLLEGEVQFVVFEEVVETVVSRDDARCLGFELKGPHVCSGKTDVQILLFRPQFGVTEHV